MLSDAEDWHDIRVMQPRRGARLAVESLDPGRRVVVSKQDLERRTTAQGQLDRLVDDPHAPSADLADDPEARDRRQRSPPASRLRFMRPGANRFETSEGDRVKIARSQVLWRALVLDGSQETGLGGDSNRIRCEMEPNPRDILSDGELFQRLLTVHASFDMIKGGLLPWVVEALFKQGLELFGGHAMTQFRSSLDWWRIPHPVSEASGWASRPLTSVWSCFVTLLRDMNTAVTFMPSREAAAAPESPSIAVRR